MEKKVLIFMTAVLVIMLAAFIFIPGPQRPDEKIKDIETNSKNIKVYNLTAGQKIISPLIIFGEADGWYFEASFPARLEDADGNILARAPAQAKTDWMTAKFVPFEVKLEFELPVTEKGFVILEQDDPSGQKENVEFIKIPVVFESSTY